MFLRKLFRKNDDAYINVAQDARARPDLIRVLEVRRVLAGFGVICVLFVFVVNQFFSLAIQRPPEQLLLGAVFVFLIWVVKLDLQIKMLRLSDAQEKER